MTVVTTTDLTIARPLATNARMRLRLGTGSGAREVSIVLNALSTPDEAQPARIAAQAIVG